MSPLFLVLEGIDGAGTTTQVRLIADELRARRVPVHTTAEPSSGPVGSLLRLMLTGRVTGASWQQLALLFAADRADHLDSEIVPNLREGVTVISDRYDHSSVAYQATSASDSGSTPALRGGATSADGALDLDVVAWIRGLNRFARRPDLTVVLDVPAAVAAERRRARSGRTELFDDDALQARLGAFYADLEQHFPGERIVHIDGTQPLAAVTAAVLAAMASVSRT
jgi:dTMP kinase